jgi:GT2 family glycosyltransferase
MQISNLINEILFFLFPPETRFERYLRTQYHRLTSSKSYVIWQIRNSRASYAKWLNKQQNKSILETFPNQLQRRVSFLLPVESSYLDAVLTTIKSIQNQRVDHWQILLVNSNELAGESKLIEIVKSNPQIILVNSLQKSINKSIELAMGQFIVCCTPGDEFSSFFLDQFYTAHDSYPDIQVFFYDCDEKTHPTTAPVPFFKPSQISPELMLSTNYLSSAIIDKKVVKQVAQMIDPHLDFSHQERELLFLLAEKSAKIQHIPQVLVHQTQYQNRNEQQTDRVILSHLSRVGIKVAKVEQIKQGRRLMWKTKEPSISIIVPTKNKPKVLQTLLNSIFSLTSYPNYEIVLVDNASDDPKVLSYYADLKQNQKIRIIQFDEPFNYSRAINMGAATSHSDLLLFLNNDMQVLQPDWLTDLAQWALLPEIGVVGAKLLHANGTIQHAGVVVGLQGFIGHLYLNAPEHYYALLGSVDWYRNVSAVTGACQMVRRSVFEELGGYDEGYQLVFSDIDFCLKAIKKGYRNLYDPFATLIHFEGQSRGYRTPINDLARAYDHLEEWLRKDDPYFSPNLTYTTIPRCQLGPADQNDRFKRMETRREMILKQLKRKQLKS